MGWLMPAEPIGHVCPDCGREHDGGGVHRCACGLWLTWVDGRCHGSESRDDHLGETWRDEMPSHRPAREASNG